MTAKDKAEELIENFKFNCRECDFEENAKQCALICVDEILKASTIKLSPSGNVGKFVYIDDFWNEVKQEIQKL